MGSFLKSFRSNSVRPLITFFLLFSLFRRIGLGCTALPNCRVTPTDLLKNIDDMLEKSDLLADTCFLSNIAEHLVPYFCRRDGKKGAAKCAGVVPAGKETAGHRSHSGRWQ